ncbi:L,D-transpeptidase family protein [Methylobacterium sp. Leaf111]|uniref:L,D-transpeptidase family protein n=1 Tax=Methylobacterium sp. Leaf111 TaxID=1736257 RepID=UPI00387E3520
MALLLALSACKDGRYAGSTRHLAPIPPETLSLMATEGVSPSDPILLRAYKKEAEIELWKRGADGRYALLKTYPMCRWSGQLGPKTREGDRQAPEGFYAITPASMNPNSSLYLSFDLGFPNAYDRSLGRTGTHLMVHGSCSSQGCFAMTDEAISELYAVVREAFAGGQRAVQFQSYPFRMTPENLARHRQDPNMAFWKNIKEGADRFEVAGTEPVVDVVGGRYAFDAGADASTADAVARKRADDERQVAALVASGTPAVRLVYEDGGQHRAFRETMMAAGDGLGEVSRPEALASGPREVAMPAQGPVALVGRREPVRSTAAPKPSGTSVTVAERRRLLETFAAAGDGPK